MYKNKKISLVIPAYNESRLIGPTLESVPKFVDKIYVVDDASTDKDQNKIILEHAKRDSRIDLIRHKTNQGCGGAVITGYLKSSKEGYDIAVVVGGDNQMPLNEMDRFLDPLVEGVADYAKGNRFLTSQLDDTLMKMPKTRLIGNWLIAAISKMASGYYKIMDFVDGYTAITKDAIDIINWDKVWRKYGYTPAFLIQLNAYSLRVVDIPRTAVYLPGEKQSQIKGFKYFVTVSPMLLRGFLWRLKFKYLYRDFHPLFLFYWLGFILLPVGLLFGAFLVVDWLFVGGMRVTGSRSVLTALLVLTGLQFLLFAMLFDMQESNK